MILIALSILVSSCDEINKLINPSSNEYLIDKIISASSAEQIVESGTDFKMIFPANSVKGDFTLKIKKEGSYPTFSIPNAKLSSNTYRIKFSGNTAFATPVKIIINYDKSQIPDGKTAAEFIQAYLYSNGNWKLATYQLDEPNSKIIISISNLETPKTNKDKPEFHGDGDLVIGNGQKTINDSGQGDSSYLVLQLKLRGKKVGGDLFMWGTNFENEPPSGFLGVWNGNTFTVNYDSTDTDVDKPGVYHYSYKLVFNSNKTKIEELTLIESWNSTLLMKIICGNIPVSVINNRYSCSITGTSLSTINWSYMYVIPIFGENENLYFDDSSFLNFSVPLKK
jgi:hypothetical protein